MGSILQMIETKAKKEGAPVEAIRRALNPVLILILKNEEKK